jgi:hypothetical protein
VPEVRNGCDEHAEDEREQRVGRGQDENEKSSRRSQMMLNSQRLPRNVDVDADVVENFERNGGGPAIRAEWRAYVMPFAPRLLSALSHTMINSRCALA